DVFSQHRRSVNVVHWDAEETLNLFCVQVNGQYTVDAYSGDHVSHYFCTDCNTRRTYTTILASITKVGDYSGNTVGRGAVHGIGSQQQFHQTVVCWSAGGLDDKHILTAHILKNFYRYFTIAEFTDLRVAEWNANVAGNFFGQ